VRELSVHPPWYSRSSLFALCVIVGGIALASVTTWALLWSVGFIAVVLAAWIFGTSVDVTETAVGYRSLPRIKKSASRDQLTAMHLISMYVTFEGDHRELLKIPTMGWTPRQWLEISAALGVPLYDHRTRMGLGDDAKHGLLMQRSGAGAEAEVR
jgi:hypothetical protein